MAGAHCSCRDKSCPMHPGNHTQGCTPCILKNLRLGEIPSCFFNKVTDDLDKLDSFSMESFAKAVLEKAEQTETGGKKMKKIGMLVAVEIGSVLGKYGQAVEEIDRFGFRVYKYILPGCELYVVHSGAGEIAAAAATQLLIAVYGVEAIVNFGVVGGLTEEMKLARTVVVERVVHYDFDTSPIDHCEVGRYMRYPAVHIPLNARMIELACAAAPELVRVTCASGDKFIDGPEKKQQLARDFDADICEMELAAIVLTCDRSGIPCLAIKTVSDAVGGGADEFSRMVDHAADICLQVTDRILGDL